MDTSPKIYINFVLPCLILLMAGFFFFIAFKTLLQRRPIVFSSRWLFALMCVAFTPMIVNSFLIGSPAKHSSYLLWFNGLLYPVLLVFLWFQMKGFMAFAVSDAYFRDALLSSAASLGYTVEETMSCVKIKETGELMQVAVQGWMSATLDSCC